MPNSLNQDGLETHFLDELHYKIWSTKESRLNANKRFLEMSRISRRCELVLLVYTITLSSLTVYNVLETNLFDKSVLRFSATTLFIVAVLLVQLQRTKAYRSKASYFRKCGLELSGLYNIVRMFKTVIANQSTAAKQQFTQKVTVSYYQIIERHQNHASIDTDLFRLAAADYHQLKWLEVQRIKTHYYVMTSLRFHLLIILPPVFLFL